MEQNETDAAGVTRGQNAAFLLPPDWTLAPAFLTPALERLDASQSGPQLLVITADIEAAVALTATINALTQPRHLALAATAATRAARALRARTVPVVCGDTAQILALVQSSALKLDGIRGVVLAWLDDLPPSHAGGLEALMADVPKDAARTIVAHEFSPAVEAFIERYARRARRVLPTPETAIATPDITLQYVAVNDALRSTALRRLLDELDPPNAFIYARDPLSQVAVIATLETLGYAVDGPVRTGDRAPAAADTLVLYDLPPTRAALREATAGLSHQRIIALVQPRQLRALREIAGGPAIPFALPEAAVRARAQEEKLREALREVLVGGAFTRELLALEPLLGDFDGIEIAAAAVHLLEVAQLRVAAQKPVGPQRVARVFINVGEQDGIRPGDLVGALTGQGGLTGTDVGKVDVRERHSLVEVPEAAMDAVAAKLTGVTLKGRQLIVRPDQDRGEQRSPARSGTHEERPRPPRDRDDSPRRSGAKREDRPRPPRDRDDGPRRSFTKREDRPRSNFSRPRDDRSSRSSRPTTPRKPEDRNA